MRTTPTAVPGAGPERGVAPYFLRLDVAWLHGARYELVRRRDGMVVQRFELHRLTDARYRARELNEAAKEGVLE